mmetsp:Transcript_2710/g.4651  ORF Transcript_2710/g.4651 Transcript_2710/m.4651 type:complete len:105 (-) Transcript_2710:939-1253(-)
MDDAYFKETIKQEFNSGSVGKDRDLLIEEALFELSDEELEILNELPDDEYELELDKLISGGSGGASGDISEVSVASQCLIGVALDDPVRIFFFGDRIAMSPQRS